ncbi:universally conserved protein [Hyperthermus butylicus DSM 5456]|uniref:Universally conserved protein n=2 Tax=Hyperthermus butylicus TaxID=54248 RepID=A2BLH9_HYPBU|nr:universally conserved protein [Hyperthermus butylicus DSM 5456]
MKTRMILASLAVLIFAFSTIAMAASNYASYGPVEFYTDKASYLPGETVRFTIVIHDRTDFLDRIDIYILRNGQVEYLWHYPADNGTGVVFYLQNVNGNSVITFSKAFSESGSYEARIAIPSLNVAANALAITFTVGPRYEIAGIVVDEEGTPVAGATVTVLETGDQVTTNSTGGFSVGVSSPGNYTLYVKANDFLPTTVTVTVEDVGTTNAGTIAIESVAHAITTIRQELEDVKAVLTQLEANLTSLTEDYQAAIEDIYNSIASLSDRLTAVESAASQLQSSLSSLNATVSQLQEMLGELQSQLSSLAQQLGELSKGLSVLAQDLNAKIEKLNSEITKIKEAYATKDELNTAINNVNSRIDQEKASLEQQISALNEEINKLKQRLDQLESATIQQLSNNIQQLTSELQSLSDKIDSASRTALIAVILAVIGIVVAVVATVLVYRKITA